MVSFIMDIISPILGIAAVIGFIYVLYMTDKFQPPPR